MTDKPLTEKDKYFCRRFGSPELEGYANAFVIEDVLSAVHGFLNDIDSHVWFNEKTGNNVVDEKDIKIAKDKWFQLEERNDGC